MTRQQADELARTLDLELDELNVCYACLSFVALPLEMGDGRAAASEARRIAPDLWAEGLALPVQAALERARRRGVPRAAEAIEEVERRGARAPIVAAVVRRLAAELVSRMRSSKVGGRNGRLTILPPPELDSA